LAANAEHAMRPGLSMSVVDTKDSFAMIPIIAGRMQTHATKLRGAIASEFRGTVAKCVILDTLVDVAKHLGPPPEVEPDELSRPQSEYWSSATNIPHPRAPAAAGLHGHDREEVRTACTGWCLGRTGSMLCPVAPVPAPRTCSDQRVAGDALVAMGRVV
jgi:hypothetical protein